jgi:hypothetical protein
MDNQNRVSCWSCDLLGCFVIFYLLATLAACVGIHYISYELLLTRAHPWFANIVAVLLFTASTVCYVSVLSKFGIRPFSKIGPRKLASQPIG